jgi:hypothetical protein
MEADKNRRIALPMLIGLLVAMAGLQKTEVLKERPTGHGEKLAISVENPEVCLVGAKENAALFVSCGGFLE